MKHFSSVEWIDLVNHVLDPSREVVMQKHLEGGCESCAVELARWGRLRQFAVREKDYQPPKDVVHMAKAAFSASGWAQKRMPAKGIMELLFDSFRQPLAAGVRSVGTAPRRMLYAVDDLKIDVQVESQADGQTIVVTGQLLDLRQPGAVARDMKVTLSNGHGRAVEVRTNEFGEFREEIENTGDLELMFPSGNTEPLVISLPNVLGRSQERSKQEPKQ